MNKRIQEHDSKIIFKTPLLIIIQIIIISAVVRIIIKMIRIT